MTPCNPHAKTERGTWLAECAPCGWIRAASREKEARDMARAHGKRHEKED